MPLQSRIAEPRTLFGLSATLAALLLSACMLVDDFGTSWDKGETDVCTSKLAESLYYTEFRRDPEGKDMSKHAHILTLGHEHFLMLKQDEADRGGRMYRFRVFNGIFQRYRLDPTLRETFEKSYPNAPVSLAHDTVDFKQLGEPELKLIEDIASKPEYWQIEDQVLYNSALNPACKYEDRDLAAIAAEGKKKARK